MKSIVMPLDQEKQAKLLSIPFGYRLVATGFGSGYSTIASGTAGSLVGLLLYLPFTVVNHVFFLALIALGCIVGTIASAKVEKALGEDPSVVVVDEIVGMWISLLFIPASVISIAAAFFLFRALDIFKPSPAREAEALKNGVGIMMDDIVAGVYTNIGVRVLLFLLQMTSFL